ncbi:uncharacterized protein LOC117785169 isoform X2 [Drosophila innubila]|uniref:uncharacterized protein LOC117785169 isoform X2 n=1 Tax=Drosophila innubila TaxID=198719 RepID=UPI00148BB403|nr:uncharacterized protein LOC117785169 isoform X2 [Drosophila innubila]
MDVPLSEFTALDLERELYAYGLDTKGTKQERYERLLAARQRFNQPHWRSRRPAITKFGARVQLDDFAEIRTFKQAECELLFGKVQWRIERVRRTEDGEGLEYFHPDVLGRIDRSKTYMLNMDEFMVRQEPYVHKIFVIFVSRTNGQEQNLCYARSIAKLRSWDENTEEFEWPLITSENIASEDAETGILQTTIITPENIAKALTYILKEIKDKGFSNYVAIACDQVRLGLPAVTQLVEASGLVMLPCIADIRDLQKVFRNMFCSGCVRCSMCLENELFTKSTYEKQLNRICNSNTTKNMNAVQPLLDYVNQLSGILLAMWNQQEHRDKPISLLGFNNRMLKIYARHVKKELPPITFEDCAAGAGLLQLIVFDALWWFSPEREPEEIRQN